MCKNTSFNVSITNSHWVTKALKQNRKRECGGGTRRKERSKPGETRKTQDEKEVDRKTNRVMREQVEREKRREREYI